MKPEYVEILKRAKEWEEKNKEKLTSEYSGFEWHDIRANHTMLRKLVIDGYLRITLKTNKTTRYRLTEKAYEFLELLEKAEKPKKEVKINIDDLFRPIVGYDDVKELIKRSLQSEKPVHVLLVGLPGTAKTLFLLEIEKLSGASIVFGSRATKAGLGEMLLKEKPRYLIIDEIDKMKREDLSILLSLMEEGRIKVDKYGMHIDEELKCWVFASANYLHKLPQELISRFLVLNFKEYSEDEFIKVAKNVLVMREGVDEELAEYIAKKVVKFSRNVRDAIKLARLSKTKEDVDKWVGVMIKYSGG